MGKFLRILFVALVAACGSTADQLASTPPHFSIDTCTRGLDTPWTIDFAVDGRIFVAERPAAASA